MSLRMAKLGDIAALNPSTPRGLLGSDEEVAFVPMAAVSETGGMRVQSHRPASEITSGLSYFANGDVLVAKITPCFENNKIALATIDRAHAFGSTEFHVLRPDARHLDPRYLSHFLRQEAIRERGKRRMTGSGGQRRVPRTFLEELTIPLPPLGEQRRLASILDQADALNCKRRGTLSAIEQFRETLFRATFVDADSHDWPSVDIGSLSQNIRTGPFGSQLRHSEFVESGVAVLGIDNAVRNEFTWSERRYITEEKYRLLSRYTVHPGDLIITIMGTCGRCAIVPDDIPLAINTKHLCCITLDRREVLPSFLHSAFLLHPDMRKQLGVQAKGAVMPGLNMGIIKSLKLRLPPLALQEAFAQKLEELMVLRATQLDHLAHLDALFASLQHRAFTGQLTRSDKRLPETA